MNPISEAEGVQAETSMNVVSPESVMISFISLAMPGSLMTPAGFRTTGY